MNGTWKAREAAIAKAAEKDADEAAKKAAPKEKAK
jgi:hypothetical protein